MTNQTNQTAPTIDYDPLFQNGPKTAEESREIANTILMQLTGYANPDAAVRSLVMMTGARKFYRVTAGVMFDIAPILDQPWRRVMIVLRPLDTYDLLIYVKDRRKTAARGAVKLVSVNEGLYDDALKEVAERVTGLVLSLPKTKRA